MRVTLERPAPSGWESWMPEYWLCHSEGFRVESAGHEPLGFVEEVVWSPDETCIDALVIRRGFDGRQTARIPIANVIELRPEASLVVVRPPADVADGAARPQQRH